MRTARIQFLELDEERAVLTLSNVPKVRNHMGTVHASAMGLLAETASGAVFGMSVPDQFTPVLKSMRIHYLKPAKGTLTAEATLSAELRRRISEDERGELVVPVSLKDESGQAPLECEMIWAWRPKRRR